MLKELERKLRRTRLNCSVNLLLEMAGRILAAAGVVVAGAVLVERLLALTMFNYWTVWGFAFVIVCVVFVVWFLKQPSAMQVALLIDERLALHERFSTTLAMRDSEDPFARAAIEETRQKVEGTSVPQHFPVRPSRCWFYVIGVWILALGLTFIPQRDLLGFLDRQAEASEAARKIEDATTVIKTNTAAVRQMVDRLGDSQLGAELAKIDEAPEGLGAEKITRQAIRKLGDLADNIKKMQIETQADSVELMEQMLKQLRSSPDAFSQQLRLALAKGNFSKAADVMEQLRKQLADGKLSESDKEALSRQLEDLAKQLEALAQQNREFEKELEKAGLGKELARLDVNRLREALQKKGLAAAKIAELLKKAQACRSASNRCSALGEAMAACAGAGGMGGDELAAVMDELSKLESFKEQARLSQAALDEIGRAIACLGEGMCDGPGGQGPFAAGLSDKYGPGTGGPGKGFGTVPYDDSGQTSTKSTRVKNESADGPAVASWYFKGEQIRGEAKREFSEVIQAGRDSVAEAISDNEIPRKYQESVRKYFGKLEEAGGE